MNMFSYEQKRIKKKQIKNTTTTTITITTKIWNEWINIKQKKKYTKKSHHNHHAVCLALVVYECTQKVHNMVAFQ